MKECKIVCCDIKSGTIKSITNVENHSINEYPLNGKSITDYIKNGYQAKRTVHIGYPSFPLAKTTFTSFANETTLFLQEV